MDTSSGGNIPLFSRIAVTVNFTATYVPGIKYIDKHGNETYAFYTNLNFGIAVLF